MSISFPPGNSPHSSGEAASIPETPSPVAPVAGESVLEKLRQRTLSGEELMALLTSYGLLPQLLREVIIDQSIAPFTCTFEETVKACKQFYEQNQITSEDDRQAWLARNHLTFDRLEALITRNVRIEKFKQATWTHKLESYFLQRKSQLDRIIYSLIRTRDLEIAQELYFRIQGGEQAFADLAREFSQGPEAQTGGLIGPVELSTPHPLLAKQLALAQPGQLLTPTRMGEWIVIARLEKLIPAQLDDSMRQRLLNELFETWVREAVKQSEQNQAG